MSSRVYAVPLAAFVSIAVTGSLFPFDFRPMPVGDAADGLWERLDLSSWSFTDVLSNCLLFVPIGLLGAAVFQHWHRSSFVALTLISGTLLSTAVESAQAFLPDRTPSLIDVASASSGTLAGIAFWHAWTNEIARAMAVATGFWRRSTRSQRLLLIYIAAFVWAWLFPFDFTIQPAEIGDKFAHKRLLFPFAPSPDAATPRQLQLMVVAAMPLGFAARGLLAGTLGMLVLLLAQTLVFSRTTDATLFVAALPGLALGVVAARLTGT